MKRGLLRCLWSGLGMMLCVALGYAAPVEVAVKAKFSGTLVENLSPCTIRPGDEYITLPLAAVTLNMLQNSQESPRYPFAVHLENCEFDATTPGRIEVFLRGNGDSNGMLQPDAGSTATGIVIGIENVRGAPLAVNAASPGLTLSLNAADIVIPMQAYLRADGATPPTAGEFTASLNYIIEYP
ncbi:fimbrial protein [Erwinia sp. DT-104]|uniref:Fimbrial protein n=2 Tax=Erwinia TaxID=551 RepID=A0ABV4E598_9GAMM|nr:MULTISPECIES: fimbrial protein [unclassified Erwinia]MDN4627754.1 fimbrial protein [Erwinia sp. PsM31]MDN8542234.1 fimbrial protein [Erwinia sp. BC051422]